MKSNKLSPFWLSLPAIRKESLLRSYGFLNKSSNDATYSNSWMGFGVLLGVLSPGYAMAVRSTSGTKDPSHLLTGLLASAGVLTYSLYYRWQSKKYLRMAWKWKDLHEEAKEAERLKSDEKAQEICEKKKMLELECNDLTYSEIKRGVDDISPVIEQYDALVKVIQK